MYHPPSWPPLFVMRSQILASLGFLCVWQVILLLLFSRIVFVFHHFYMNCQGVDIILPSVEFTDLRGCLDECVSSAWEFPVMISLNNFFGPFSLSSVSATHVTHTLVSLCPTFLWVSVYFSSFFFSLDRLHKSLSINCSADFSASSSLLLNPSSKFFISGILLKLRVSLWFFCIF